MRGFISTASSRSPQADAACGAQGNLLKETARHLAVRMSYEDVVRVAQAKISPERMRRIARDELRVKDEPYSVHDFLKPGIEELCQLLPPFLARPILRAVGTQRLARPRLFRHGDQFDLDQRLFALPVPRQAARPSPLRPSLRAGAGANRILARLIADAARLSPGLALEIAECARLIKGYGDTLARGLGNFHLIEARLIRPALAGQIPPARAADAVASARTAALVDPEGESLATCLAEIEAGRRTASRRNNSPSVVSLPLVA